MRLSSPIAQAILALRVFGPYFGPVVALDTSYKNCLDVLHPTAVKFHSSAGEDLILKYRQDDVNWLDLVQTGPAVLNSKNQFDRNGLCKTFDHWTHDDKDTQYGANNAKLKAFKFNTMVAVDGGTTRVTINTGM